MSRRTASEQGSRGGRILLLLLLLRGRLSKEASRRGRLLRLLVLVLPKSTEQRPALRRLLLGLLLLWLLLNAVGTIDRPLELLPEGRRRLKGAPGRLSLYGLRYKPRALLLVRRTRIPPRLLRLLIPCT